MYQHFNHDQLRRYLTAFGTFFTNIELVRKNVAGQEVQRMVVPIDYGPKEKWLYKIVQDPDMTRGVGTVVPRMTYQMAAIGYDAHRKLNTLHQFKYPVNTNRNLSRLFVGVPYILTIDLTVLVKNQADGFQIVEQILPAFTPDLTFKLNVIPELGLVDQVPLTLSSITPADNYEGNLETRRIITWTMSFSMKVYFYGPKATQGQIHEIDIDLYNAPADELRNPPVTLATEERDMLEMEDDSGHLMDEQTANSYLTLGKVANINVTLDPADQEPSEDPTVTETITEYE